MEHEARGTVIVTFNGEDKSFPLHPHEKVEHLLRKAVEAFGITTNPHLMGLFREDGTELKDHETLHEAGVRDGEVLILRQSTVRGG